MRNKGEAFNNRLKEGIQRLNGITSGQDFVEPETITEMMMSDAKLHNEADKYAHKILFSIGLVNKELKSNVKSYLDLWSSFKQRVDAHNEELASERISEIDRLINPVE